MQSNKAIFKHLHEVINIERGWVGQCFGNYRTANHEEEIASQARNDEVIELVGKLKQIASS